MKEAKKRLQEKLISLEATLDDLYMDFGRAYSEIGTPRYNEPENKTAKIETKIRNHKAEIEKVKIAIAQVRELEMTVA